MIKKIFIANRGEIARRIASTAKKMGIQTAVINDRLIPPLYLSGIVTDFIQVSDETTQTYLNATLMIDYALAAGCDAVHPGFGFLSENADFAKAVSNAGLTWIGPNPSAIDAMASKATARRHAEDANVPCLSGLSGLDLTKDETASLKALDEFAQKTGFPLLLKAAYGGGGKGMRIAQNRQELPDFARRAASEALSSFGNGSLIVETYLPAPRHVEVQVLADKHGRVCIIGDRDCSLQRRHQKILEEAPAPNIPDDIRKAMHAAATSLAAKVGYDNAGTVEFLLDESNDKNVRFYFLEMNTRLQVEHTVTEEVHGLDLVEWQIRVACGEHLPAEFESLNPRGHSIEVRIYAEDPGANFFPAPGAVRAFVPAQGRGIRWEIGLDTIDEITTKFDPMISKLVVTAGDRLQVLDLLTQTLERTVFCGPRNNIPFLIWLAQNSDVRKRPVSTHFIGGNVERALQWEMQRRKELDGLVQDLLTANEKGQFASFCGATNGVSIDAITLGAFAKHTSSSVNMRGKINILLQQDVVSSQDRTANHSYGLGTIEQHGKNIHFIFARYLGPELAEYWIGIEGHNWVRNDERVSSSAGSATAMQGDGLSAPVPGKVMSVFIKPGSSVKPGDTLFILESMKMQFEVKSFKDGSIQSVLVTEGMQVSSGQKLGEWA